jgi:hypothetical protein
MESPGPGARIFLYVQYVPVWPVLWSPCNPRDPWWLGPNVAIWYRLVQLSWYRRQTTWFYLCIMFRPGLGRDKGHISTNPIDSCWKHRHFNNKFGTYLNYKIEVASNRSKHVSSLFLISWPPLYTFKPACRRLTCMAVAKRWLYCYSTCCIISNMPGIDTKVHCSMNSVELEDMW